jgi:multiple sugar transport system substrate-binding protein
MHQYFQGLTWDHPRGYRALEAAALRTNDLLRWSRQPLEGFESHPIADLAQRYDLLVLDHPHIGEAVAEDCLQPLEDVFGADEIVGWQEASIGAALQSYRWDGRHYALPLDVAMQVMARDPDRLRDAPVSWDEVLFHSERMPVALSLAGPHAVLTFFSLCLSLGEQPGSEHLVSDAIAGEALDRMRRLAANAPAGSETLNPIKLLEAIANRSDIALVPLVFGYVNYAVAKAGKSRVAFSNAPVMTKGGRRGSVLGGTGIAITRRAEPSAALLDHLRWLMSPQTQLEFIPAHEGQPSARSAWASDTVNAAWSGFYRATHETAEQAWVRPRFDGYIAFQTRASEAIRDGLASTAQPSATLSRLRELWRSARSAARGPLSA